MSKSELEAKLADYENHIDELERENAELKEKLSSVYDKCDTFVSGLADIWEMDKAEYVRTNKELKAQVERLRWHYPERDGYPECDDEVIFDPENGSIRYGIYDFIQKIFIEEESGWDKGLITRWRYIE